jgi:hypothetical protein
MILMLILLQTATDVYCTWDSCEGEDTLSRVKSDKSDSLLSNLIYFSWDLVGIVQSLSIRVECSSSAYKHLRLHRSSEILRMECGSHDIPRCGPRSAWEKTHSMAECNIKRDQNLPYTGPTLGLWSVHWHFQLLHIVSFTYPGKMKRWDSVIRAKPHQMLHLTRPSHLK